MFLLIHDIKEILIETHCFFLLTWKGNILLLLLLSLCLYMHVFDKPYFSSSDGTTQSLGTCLRDFRNKPYPVRAKITYYQKTLSVGKSYINSKEPTIIWTFDPDNLLDFVINVCNDFVSCTTGNFLFLHTHVIWVNFNFLSSNENLTFPSYSNIWIFSMVPDFHQ